MGILVNPAMPPVTLCSLSGLVVWVFMERDTPVTHLEQEKH